MTQLSHSEVHAKRNQSQHSSLVHACLMQYFSQSSSCRINLDIRNSWMDEENSAYVHNRVPNSHEEEETVISRKIYGTGAHHGQRNYPGLKIQVSHFKIISEI